MLATQAADSGRISLRHRALQRLLLWRVVRCSWRRAGARIVDRPTRNSGSTMLRPLIR